MRASVVLSNYNYGRFVGEAIESALAQTHSDTEVIVVDDGSTDHSREVIGRYDGRVVSVLKDNGGQASALNAGFAQSSGEAVIFLDSDDVLLPTAVECVVAELRDPDVAKVHWTMPIIDEHGRETGELEEPDLAEGDLREAVRREGPLADMTMPNAPTSGNAWARRFLDQVMPIPEEPYRAGADTYLFGMAPAFGRVVRLADPQSLYRAHEANCHLGWSFRDILADGVTDHRVLAPRVAQAFARRGIAVDLRQWERRSWFLRLDRAVREVLEQVPAGTAFALVDQDSWGTDEDFFGRRRVRFPKQDGEYAGLPADDSAAIAEAERLRQRGITHLVIAWPAYWWLDYFQGFRRYLHEHWRCRLENDVITVFELAGDPVPVGADRD